MTKERKDFYWLNDDSISFLRSGYLEEKYLDNPVKRYEEIAISAEKILKIKGFADKFLGYLAKGYYSISSPITSNFGNNRGCSISCFGNYISDDMSDILDNAAEVGMMTKLGGGTSAYFGDLRASGSPLSMGGTSSGPVHFMSIFDTVANVVSQSSIRRGAFAAYLNVDHPDFLDFLKIRSDGHYIQNLHFGACITDDFMNKLVGGDKKARKIWAEIIKKRYASGYPYLFFTDTVNNKAPKVYRDKGMKIHASNLCVAGDQIVATKYGLRSVYDLWVDNDKITANEYDHDVQRGFKNFYFDFFDGFNYVKSSGIRMTRENQNVVTIFLENGLTHKVTLDHKIKTKDGIKKACDINNSDEIAIQSLPISISRINCFEDFIKFVGSDSLNGLSLKKLRDLFEFIKLRDNGGFDRDRAINIHVEKSGFRYFCILLNSFCLKYFYEVVGDYFYFTIIGNSSDLSNTEQKYSKVHQIKYSGREDVYCCTIDSEDHLWTCNGVITHNCSEIALSASTEESFVCNISSVNVLHWDEIQKTDAVKTLFYLLDANTTEFIEKTNGIRSMAKANMFARKQRALGLGVLGYHSLLQSKMIPFESMEAKRLNAEIFSTIRNQCDEANRELAEKYGEPYLLQGHNQRCVTTMAIAPTVSSSIILGQVSSGIEPIMDNYYIKNTAKGDITVKNGFLFDLLESKGKNTQEISDSILQNSGSCQHLDFLSAQEKAVFKTFAEISQAEIVTQAAQRQRWIDQSQSLNLKIPDHANPKDVSNLLIDGWRNGIKTFYYQHNSNLAQEASRDLFRCTSCEG